MKTLSIITINYNNLSGLQKTMESVLSQTRSDFEYIVIDGGSTDGSREAIYEKKDRLAYWVSEPDDGIYEAMNKGISTAKGHYLLFINSGDLLADNRVIESVVPLLETGEDIIYGNLKISSEGKITEGYMPDQIDLRQMMNDTLWHPVSFIKRDLFLKFGMYNPSYRIVGDYEFFFNVIISKKVSTKHINRFIAIFDLNGMSSLPSNTERIRQERARVQSFYLSESEMARFKEEELSKKSNPKNGFLRRWFR